MKLQKLETTAFISGSLVMILELTGSRVLSPYFGNSIYIWTGLIGLILGFLSLGYHFGGKLADKSASLKLLATLLFYASIFVFFIAFIKEPVLKFITSAVSGDIRTGSALSIIILFGPASLILGTVTPMIAKLKLNNLKSIGQDAGQIYTLSTLGSIFGTFLSGYFLIPTLGNTQNIYLISLTLFLTSLWIGFNLNTNHKITLLLLATLYSLNTKFGYMGINTLADIDTNYNRVLVREYQVQNKKIRTLTLDNSGVQSAVDANNPNDLFTDYLLEFANITKILEKPLHSLLIGGAGFIYPRYYTKNNLGVKIDVVEIDPKMAEIARKYFFLQDSDRIKIISDDARNYPKYANKKYEIIYLDAFSSIVPPHHLTTKEYMEDLSGLLTNRGVLIINLISATERDNSQFLTWQTSTLKSVFPYVSIFKTETNKTANKSQNIILIASKNNEEIAKIDTNPKYLKTKLKTEDYFDENKVLTDNYAPVEHLTASLLLK